MVAGVKRSLLAPPPPPFIRVCVSQVVLSDAIVVKAAEMCGEAVAVVRMTGLGYALYYAARLKLYDHEVVAARLGVCKHRY